MARLMPVLLVLLLCGCRGAKVVTVERVRVDTAYITKEKRDSIRIHDSIYLHEYTKGDTVYIERTRWHRAVEERLRVDTIYKARVDSVPVPYEVERIVYRQRWWQRWLNYASLFVILIGFLHLSRMFRRP